MNTNTLEKMTLRDLLRGAFANRWHTVPTVMAQNVAEHSHQVGLIAEAMLVQYYALAHQEKPTIEARYLCLKYAQLHDLPEVLLGDLPSPVKALMKQEIPGFAEALRAMEHKLIPELAELEEAMQRHPYLPVFLKAADIVEAQLFFSHAKGRDEEQTRIVADKLDALLQDTIKKGEMVSPHSEAMKGAIDQVCASIFGQGSSAVIRSEGCLPAA